MIKIFIAENIPSLNKGELTILGGMMESFKQLGDFQVSMMSSFTKIDSPRYGDKIKLIDTKSSFHIFCDPLSKFNLISFINFMFITFQYILFLLLYKLLGNKTLRIMRSDIWKEFATSDVLIIGHNGTFGIGGHLFPNAPIYSLFSYLYLPFMSNVLNKPLIIYAGSIGPFYKKRKIIRKWMTYLFENVNLITLREDISFNNLNLMGVRGNNFHLTSDIAFLLESAPYHEIEKIIKKEDIDKLSRPLIGITLTKEIASMGPRENSREQNYKKHVALLVDTINGIINKFGASIIFLPHCIGFGENNDDRLVARDVFNELKDKNHVLLITNEYSAEELKGLIGICDLFIGERIHSVINALSMHIPSLVLSSASDQRLRIIEMMGQSEAILTIESLNSENLMNKIENFISHKEDIKKVLRIDIETIKSKSRMNIELLKQLLLRD
jgi:polysaccharide pyruvyl transferase WcaK-like protein